MEKGTLRVDANVSVRPAGSDELRTRCEIKNMNSFTHIARGIEAEIARQVAVWESGGEVEQHTYDFDVGSGTLTARRTKEEADDYRYFPEPDLVPVEPPAELVERLRARAARASGRRESARVAAALDHERALVLVTGGLDALWEATVAAGAERGRREQRDREPARRGRRRPRRRRPGPSSRSSSRRASGSRERRSTRRSRRWASRASRPSRTSRRRPSPTRLRSSRSSTRCSPRNPAQVEQYRGGKDGLLGFFVGQVMKETKGQADPRAVNELVRAKLAATR